MTADFSGYATRSNVRCSDGRTILADAFAGQDGQVVPLVWQHGHDDVSNVLGHVKLENVNDGVRVQAFFNETAKGKHAKEMVRHGDVRWMSIWANGLVEKAKTVAHGVIREVSLVLAGANPGATIDQVAIAHSDGSVETFEDEAYITTGLDIEIPNVSHADTATATTKETTNAPEGTAKGLKEILDTLDDEQSTAVNFLLTQALTEANEVKHSEATASSESTEGDNAEGDNAEGDDNAEGTEGGDNAEGTEGDDNAEGTEGDNAEGTEGDDNAEGTEGDNAEGTEGDNTEGTDSVDNAEGTDGGDNAESTTSEAGDDAVQHDNQEDNSMTHNVFDQSKSGSTLAHNQIKLDADQVQGIIKHADEIGSLKKAINAFVTGTGVTVDGELKHGIENIDYLFPDSKVLDASPAFVSRRMEWVTKVLDGVRKSPFSRIKTITADITPDEARARGYITGNMKNEEYFALAKRETSPQTIYKKQKLDRDDVIDIVDLDVVAWMKAEMKVMLDEELAGAILVGDGRSTGDDDKIKEDKIRPIASDDELYVTTVNVNLDDASSSIEELVDQAISHRRYYKGTGSPSFFTTEATVSAFLSQKDGFGRRIYTTLEDVKTVLRVSEIVPVEILERVPDVVGIMVNLTDYTLGADRGGQATMFDDFDIDYNKLRYLIETRCSGALTLPKSALVFRKVAAGNVLVTPTAPGQVGNVVTVPTVTGVVYKDGAGTTLTTGSPVTLTAGQELHVKATPASGKYFSDNANDEWDFVGE